MVTKLMLMESDLLWWANSVGGNMAAVTALMAKEKKGPEIKVQILLWPVTDATLLSIFVPKHTGKIVSNYVNYEVDVEPVHY